MPAPEGKFRTKRHPHCPECRYDLVATVDAGRRTCPECGYEFELDELHGEKRPGDWTPLVGLRRAAVYLLLRVMVLLPVWAGVIWVCTPLLRMFPLRIGSLGGMAILMAIPGMIVGHVLGLGLTEKAGFQSFLLTVMAGVAAVGVVYGGFVLSGLSRPLSGWVVGFSMVSAMAFAIAWVVKRTLLDD